MFADDIILMSPTAQDMHDILQVCQNFARRNGLEWGISKSFALAAPSVTRETLYLDGKVLKYSSSAEYLGVDLDVEDVTDAATIERI